MKFRLTILWAILALAGIVRAQEPNPKDLVKPLFLADTAAIQPGKPFQIGILLALAPHWHVYWTNVGEAGIPTKVDLTLPDGFTASAIQYPVPSRLIAPGDITMYGYEDKVMLIATITPPAKINAARIDIVAKASWLVCENSCYPGDALLKLTVPVGNSTPSNIELFSAWNKRLPVSVAGSEIADVKSTITMKPATSASDKGELSVTIQWKDTAPASIDWFPPASDVLSFEPKISISTKDRVTTIKAPFEIASTKKISAPLESVLAYKTSAGIVGATVPLAVELPGH